MDKVLNWFRKYDVNSSTLVIYNIEGRKESLSLTESVKGAISRLSEDTLLERLEKIEKYYKDRGSYSKEISIDQATVQEGVCFIKDMSTHMFYKEHFDFTLIEVASNCGVSEPFLHWWMIEKGLTDHQMRCDHDDSDQFSEDGSWYNSVGTCIKCLVDISETLESNEESEMIIKAWNNGRSSK